MGLVIRRSESQISSSSMKILFLAPNPRNQRKIEGYLQRVQAIDAALAMYDTSYMDDYASREDLAKAMLDADVIYSHSLYRLEDISEAIPAVAEKIILDLHGIVPEEEKLLGRSERFERLNDIESVVFSLCKVFIAVTKSMKDHYIRKYPSSKTATWIILPIFEPVSLRKRGKLNHDVVYAGGAQAWQNVDAMVEMAKTDGDDRKYYFLSRDTDEFARKIGDYNGSNIIVRSVQPSRVYDYYKKCAFGFVLRDDDEVNRVACPTKLIEYLGYGIVPIVKFADIGDFNSIGYKYISLESMNGTFRFSDEDIWSIIENNRRVYEDLSKISSDGIKTLCAFVRRYEKNKQKNRVAGSLEDALVENISLKIEKSDMIRESVAMKYQINVQADMINDYADSLRECAEKNNTYEWEKQLNMRQGWSVRRAIDSIRRRG